MEGGKRERGDGGWDLEEGLNSVMSSQSLSSLPAISSSPSSPYMSRPDSRGSSPQKESRKVSERNLKKEAKEEKRDARASGRQVPERKLRVGGGGSGDGLGEGGKGEEREKEKGEEVTDVFLYGNCQLVGRGEVLLDPSTLPEGKIEVAVMSNEGEVCLYIFWFFFVKFSFVLIFSFLGRHFEGIYSIPFFECRNNSRN